MAEFCNICGKPLNTWDLRLSKIFAYKHPVCEMEIAKENDMDRDAFRARMEDYLHIRPCQGL